ncbi:MutS2 family protein [Bacillus sp. OV194]|nr:MutS2 family protein [Bacillus sp. OV194]
MNTHTINMLEFNKITETLSAYGLNESTKRKILELMPSGQITIIKNWLRETTEAAAILRKSSSVPIANLNGIDHVMTIPDKGLLLSPEQLQLICGLAENVERLQRYMKDKEFLAPTVSAYAYSLFELKDLKSEIQRCIRNGRVDDGASKPLEKVRKRMLACEEKIKAKLDHILKSPAYRDMLQEPMISVRDGRYAIPVKSKFKRSMDGQIIDSSSSGSTVFIEPKDVRKLQDELQLLQAEEDIETARVLGRLTGLVAGCKHEISVNIEGMLHYDFIFAKAKYSIALDGREVSLNREKRTIIHEGRHPLLGSHAVPLNFRLGENYGALVITGPNTGGKTVAIKTAGLLTLMVQSGLHIPAGEGSEFGIYSEVLTDIGDHQNIEQSLSTFSAHMTNIISILQKAGPDTLVILDELGAGTDPAEGMGLAVAILEELFERGASILATTHYSEIKDFAYLTPGFENASMAFDLESLKPLYELKIGEAGESQAFSIAWKLGLEQKLITRAKQITSKEVSEKKESTMFDLLHVEAQTQMLRKRREAEEGRNRKIREAEKKTEEKPEARTFEVGDRVYVSSLKTAGIICSEEDKRGEYEVIVQGEKVKIHKLRLTLHISRTELYPEGYDMDIVFETKENRKKDRLLSKRHVDGMVINRDEE